MHMSYIKRIFLISIVFYKTITTAFSGSPEVTVVIDGYTVDSTQSSPASLPLGTALVLVCRVSGIPQRQIKYNWTCPDGLCECPGYVGRKVVNDNILAVNITSDSDGGTYTCAVSGEEADGGYNQNYTLNVSGGHVVHSYGRLFHREYVITRGDQLLPPGDETGPGRMDCIRTAPETAHFDVSFVISKPPNNLVNQSDGGDDQMATLFFNRSYLSMKTFKNVEGICGTYFYLYLLPGILPNVTIMSIEPRTTDARIVINNISSDIRRVNVGYERHDLGVTLWGKHANIFRNKTYTFSSLVPGARYTVVLQGLTGVVGNRSQHVTRRDFKTEETKPSVPRYPCIISESEDGIHLNWIPPLEPNGDVYYLMIIDDGNRTVTVNTSSGSTYFNLTGLQRGVTYNITVVAVNSVGRSDDEPVLKYTHNPQSNTPSPKYPAPSQKCHTEMIVSIAIAIIMILLVIITILSVLLIWKRKKQRPTVEHDQVTMPEVHDEVNDIEKPTQVYQDLVVNKIDDDAMSGDDYEELDAETMDETTQYASLN